MSVLHISAEKLPEPSTKPLEKTIRIPLGRKSPSRNSPSRILLEGVVTESGIVFYPAEWYTTILVTITSEETGEVWFGISSNRDDMVPFDGENGYYTICVHTPEGGVFYGGFEIQFIHQL